MLDRFPRHLCFSSARPHTQLPRNPTRAPTHPPPQLRHVAPARAAPRRGVPLPRGGLAWRGRPLLLGVLRPDRRPRRHLGLRHRPRRAAPVPRLLLGRQGRRGPSAARAAAAQGVPAGCRQRPAGGLGADPGNEGGRRASWRRRRPR